VTGIVYDDIYLKHTRPDHPENARRLEAIVEHLKKVGLWEQMQLIPPRQVTQDQIESVHSWPYLQKVKKLCRSGGGFLDPDTYVTPVSYEVACYAAGGVLAACDAVVTGKVSNALALVRPPGHHATSEEGMGFCIFNNVAIAARYLQGAYRIWKIAIIDWDVHHGNGTQSIFYSDPSVFYVSLHRFPFFPGTGSAREVGEGAGRGFTKNVPISPGMTAKDYIGRFQNTLKQYLFPFKPEMILISSGFDAFASDPIGGLNLWPEDFAKLTEIVLELAEKSTGGRVVSALEGGYSIEALPACVEQHLRVLAR